MAKSKRHLSVAPSPAEAAQQAARRQRFATGKRLFAEMMVVIAIGFMLALFMYASGFRACCEVLSPVLGIALFPAMQVSAILGSGIRNVTAVDFAIGLAVELTVLWALGHGAIWVIRRK